MVLVRHDAQGYVVLDAISHLSGPPSPSLANLHQFIAVDGQGYWIKSASQGGLVKELVCGRLAAAIGVGPVARVLRVPREAVPADGSANHLVGVNVGLENIHGTVNVKDLDLLGIMNLDPNTINAMDRAAVVAFHSWTGLADAQVLVNLQTGRLHTIDFGDAFSGIAGDPGLVLVDLPGVDRDHGNDYVATSVANIEAMTDDQILEAVARIQSGEPWGDAASFDSRLRLAERLAHRALRWRR